MFNSTIIERRLSPLVTCLDIENTFATARISLWGAQVLSFVPRADQRERLFLSPQARFDGSKAIRGGVPLCWPWFGAHPESNAGQALPSHGYARTRRWQLLESTQGPTTRLLLVLPDPAGAGFAGSASVSLEVLVGRELTLTLRTLNTGNAAFPLTTALHSYFSVADIRQCELRGLSGMYSDKTRNWAMLETPQPYRFSEETDRIHLQAANTVTIVEPACATPIRSAGHDSIVVWNPWADNSRLLPDMGEDAYRNMLCVETAVTQGCQVQPGATHTLTQIIC
jgi:glucose-6-phosphate 1-epimerase